MEQRVPLIKILAFYGFLMSVQTNTGYIYVAVGKPRIITVLAGMHAVLLLSLLTVGTAIGGVSGAAWALVGTVSAMLPVGFVLLRSVLKIHGPDLFRAFSRPLTAALAMYASVSHWQTWIMGAPGPASAPVALLSSIAVGAALYASIVIALWLLAGRPQGAESFVYNKGIRVLERLRGRFARR